MILTHNILQFYFEAFCEAGNSSAGRSGPKSLWINNKRLSLTWRHASLAELWPLIRGVNSASFEADLIAEKLTRVGQNYLAIIKKVHSASALDRNELMDLSFLILTLLTNAESPSRRTVISERVNPDELTWEKFESAVSDAEIQSKRKRSSLPIPEGDLLDHGMHFILNRTGYPFITSDRAIFVDSWDSNEAQRTFGPLNILDPNVSGSTERAIVFPLSPEAILISSSYVKRDYPGDPYVECSSAESIFDLNLLAGHAADRIIVSNQDKPFGWFEEKARAFLSTDTLS